MNDIAIKIENVKKKYKLGTIGGGTLTGEIKSWWAKKRGKEDPNRMVGMTEPIVGDEFWALKGINLEIKKGDRLGIIGRNGAGKSTLLKILSRVTAPTEGKITINGRIASMLEVGTGFHGELTGRENIYLNGAILGMSRQEIDKKIDQIIEFSECGEFIDTPVKRYSSGMYVKLAFSVAAHLDSDIMIMDEVLAVGDVNFQRKCLDKMTEIAENEGKTILYVSHNMSTIRRLCNKCVVLNKGQIIYQGDIENAVQMYLQIPDKMNLHNEFSNRFVEDEQFNRKLRLISLDLLDRENNQIELGETIKFRIKFKCENSVPRAYIRCIVARMDDTRVGVTFSPAIYDCKEETIKQIECSFDTSTLAPGKYGLNIILFDCDGAGNQEKYEMISNALVIEVIRTKGQIYNLEWELTNYGSTLYPELEIKEV